MTKEEFCIDDLEMRADVQEKSTNYGLKLLLKIPEISDLEGYRSDFHNLFGFGFDGVDYKAEARWYR
jgi:enoyl-[acyl-carrier protein] reductase/trans-2-enoyl-CoA reductase (NAD+)